MKKILMFLGVCFLLTTPIFSQTAAEIETLLATAAVNYEQAASFVLRAADVQASGSALSYASEQKWLSAKAALGGTAALNEVSLLVMGAFGVKGGVMYSLVKSPHHAYRELVYKGMIRGDSDPDMKVSGEQLLLIVSRVLSIKEKEEGQK